jgi:hypothetical protein
MREGAVRDDVHLGGLDARRMQETRTTVLGVDDDRVDAIEEAPLAGAGETAAEVPAPRLAGQDVVGGEHERPPPGEQARIQRRDRQPLEVHGVGRTRRRSVAEHVGDVLGELGGQAQARARPADGGRAPVEALLHGVARAPRDGAVGEAARDEPDVGPGPGQAGAERVVVGRRVRRRIDDVDAHSRGQ